MRVVFNTIKHFVRFYKKQYFHIEQIEQSKSSGAYIITFFSPRTRQLFVKSANEIRENKRLLIGFEPLDAAMIGKLIAMAYYEKLYKNNISK